MNVTTRITGLIEGALEQKCFELAIVFSASHCNGGFLDLCNRASISPIVIRDCVRDVFTGRASFTAGQILSRAMI